MKAVCVFLGCPLGDDLKHAILGHRFDVCACELAKYKTKEEDTALIDAIATGDTEGIQNALQKRMTVLKRTNSDPTNICSSVHRNF